MGYEHTQKCYRWFFIMIPVFIVVLSFIPTYMIGLIKSNAGVIDIVFRGGGWFFFVIFLVLLWAVLFLSRLKVWIDAEFVRIRFGCGTWRKKFALDKIQSAAPVRNDWLMGWGIHYVGNGWLYNIGGLDAVEITFKNGKKARIGTDEPEKLAAAIQTALK